MGSSTIKNIIVTTLLALLKIVIISIAGILCAIYPKNDPLLSQAALKYLSRLSNLLFLPCLVVASLGSALSPSILRRIGIMIPFGLVIICISYMIVNTLGTLMHEKDARLFRAVAIAVGSPNAVSFPLLVMET